MTHQVTHQRRPKVTVIIASHQGQAHVGDALESLVTQRLDARLFETVLVVNGEPDRTCEIVDEIRLRSPQHQIRLVHTAHASASNARNIGLRVATGEYITFMDDDDRVSPDYLSSLLDAAAPGIVPVAFMADVVEGDDAAQSELDASHYFTGPLLAYAGEVVPAEKVASALSANVCKLIPVSVARQVTYRTNLRSGEDFVYWTENFARSRFCFRVLDADSRAIYYRTVRPSSVSRQPTSYDFNVSQRLECIEALSSLDDSHHKFVRAVVRGKITAQVGHVRNYLACHPDRREDVLADIRSRNLPWFPYASLNRNTARELAFLYCFVPYRDTSAFVSARRIRERGEVVDVIGNRLDKLRPTDEWSIDICHEYLDTVILTQTPQAMGNWRTIRLFVEAALAHADSLAATKGAYRTVYSRAMWPASHFAAAAYKVRHPDVHWIAEFSDPMLHDITGDVRSSPVEVDELSTYLQEALLREGHEISHDMSMWEWVELVAYGLADEIVFTNENQRRYMLSYASKPELASRAESVSRVAHHPTLPEEFYRRRRSDYPLADGLRHIAYFGAFYATRGVGEVMQALNALPPELRSRLRIHVFTDSTTETQAVVDDLGVTSEVAVNAYLPFLDFLNLTTRFDVLLVTDASTRDHHAVNPYLPSKLSDYRGSGRPIWSIVEEGSVLSSLPSTYKSLIGDVEEAAKVLREIAADTTQHLNSGTRRGESQRDVVGATASNAARGFD